MKGMLGGMRNVYGERQASTPTRRMRTREKIVAGIRLDVPDEHAAKNGSGHGEGEGTWIFSFCDLIMNLLMFFVMMFAISSVDKGKLAIIQNALVSYSKDDKSAKPKPAEETSQEKAEQSAATSSPEDVMKRIRELLSSIDVSKLQVQAHLKKDFDALKNRVIDLEKLVGAQVMPDQDEASFQIVIAERRVFGEGGVISEEGRTLLKRLVTEISRFKSPLRLSILNGGLETTKGVSSDGAWQKKALNAVAVGEALRAAGLGASHVLSAGGLGPSGSTDAIPQWQEHVVIHVAPLRDKPYIHRGKDSIQ
jgi:hypothetical protein